VGTLRHPSPWSSALRQGLPPGARGAGILRARRVHHQVALGYSRGRNPEDAGAKMLLDFLSASTKCALQRHPACIGCIRASCLRYSIFEAHDGSLTRIKPIASVQASPCKRFNASRFNVFLRIQISASDSLHEAATELGVTLSNQPTVWLELLREDRLARTKTS